MKLPNHDQAIVPREKIVDYLLSPSHRDGHSKATCKIAEGNEMKQSLRVTLFLIAFHIDVSSYAILAQQPTPIAGGYQGIAKTDFEVKSAARFAVKKEQRKEHSHISLVSIEYAEKQVVAGTNYRLCIKVRINGRTQDVVAVVYENLKGKFSLSGWDRQGCKAQG